MDKRTVQNKAGPPIILLPAVNCFLDTTLLLSFWHIGYQHATQLPEPKLLQDPLSLKQSQICRHCSDTLLKPVYWLQCSYPCFISVKGKWSQANSLIYSSLTCSLHCFYIDQEFDLEISTFSDWPSVLKKILPNLCLAFLPFLDPFQTLLHTLHVYKLNQKVLDLLQAICCFLLYFILEFIHICYLKNISERNIVFL